ncbi:MAG: RdgB/HAM1 family non-canonical purine NTP pyrophosphatase [Phycisphaerae bacterium]
MAKINSLIVATTNIGKVREIQHELDSAGLSFIATRTVADLPGYQSPQEDQPTFIGNAIIKATAAAKSNGSWALADDSGLCVPTLGGMPGVYSARFAGPDATDDQNNTKLITQLRNLKVDHHPASYVCVVALACPQALVATFTGHLEGEITLTPKGSGGFGYDPYFFIPPLGRTAAELTLDEKSQISHRGIAIRFAIRWIRTNLPRLSAWP